MIGVIKNFFEQLQYTVFQSRPIQCGSTVRYWFARLWNTVWNHAVVCLWTRFMSTDCNQRDFERL